AHACKAADETVFRILYYDCAMYSGTVKLPVSGTSSTFTSSDAWLHTLSHKDLFAVRRGVLKFRGYKPKKTPVATKTALTDADFAPDFEQKGVDMRIGLDIASYSESHAVDRIVLVSADTDCVPALKYGRRAGLQTVLIEPQVTGVKLAPELLSHADFKRKIALP
ncbi:MAG: NYN domain-containing protein, partial [Silvibacterium sp.]